MIRWILWAIFGLAWTAALELPVPKPEHLPAGEFILTNRVLVAKGTHVVVYMCFAMLSGWVAIPVRYRFLMMFFLMAHAWGTELLQSILEPIFFRGGKLTDVGLDVIGIVVGVALTWKWWTRDERISLIRFNETPAPGKATEIQEIYGNPRNDSHN